MLTYDLIIFNIIDKRIDLIINGWFGLLTLILLCRPKSAARIHHVTASFIPPSPPHDLYNKQLSDVSLEMSGNNFP